MTHKLIIQKRIVVMLLFAFVLYYTSDSQALWNKTYIEDRPTMLFSSVINNDTAFKISGVVSGYPNNAARGIVCNVDRDGVITKQKIIIDSTNVLYGMFWNTLVKDGQGNLAFVGYAYDSLPAVLFGWTDEDLDSLLIFNYQTPQTGAFQGYNLLLYDDSTYYIIGVRTSSATPSDANVLLMKVKKNGQRVWERYYHQRKVDYAKKIIKLNNGHLLLGAFRNDLNQTDEISNTWLMEVDTGGTIIRQWFDPNDSTYAAEGLLQTQDGGFVYGAQKKIKQAGDVNCVGTIVKMDVNFTKEWTFTDGSPSPVTGIFDLLELPDGNFIGCGNKPFYNGDSSMLSGWIVKLSSTGNVIWNRTYAGLATSFSYNYLSDIDVLSDGSLIVVGQCQHSGQVPPQVGWFLKLDSNGCEIENCMVGIEEPAPTSRAEGGGLNSQIQVWPNPFASDLSIALTGGHVTNATFTITNIMGQTVHQETEKNVASGYTKILDLNYLPNGVYFVAVSTGEGTMVERVLKQ